MNCVAKIIPSGGDDDPQLNFEACQIDWHQLGINRWKFPAGPVDVGIRPQVAVVDHPLAATWDWYDNAGTWGIFSRKLKEIVAPYCQQCFAFWPVSLNGLEYFVVRKTGEIDCLDRDSSCPEVVVGHRHYITHVFDVERLPESAFFTIPETSGFFATADVARLLLRSELRGFVVLNAAGNIKTQVGLEWDPDW